MRVDYKIAQGDQLYGRISEGAQDSPGINSFRLFFDSFNLARLENGVINWTHNFSPNVLNEVAVGANYVRVTMVRVFWPSTSSARLWAASAVRVLAPRSSLRTRCFSTKMI